MPRYLTLLDMTTNFSKSLLKTCLKSFSANNKTIQIRSNSTYKAAVLKEAHQPLVIEEKTRSKLSKTDVRIKVHYCSVNSFDTLSFRDSSKELPFVPGYELAGEVLERGSKVTNEQVLVGERVAALSLDKFGGFAEECVVNVNDCFRVPTNVTLKDAAVLTYGHTLAVYTFSKLCTIKEDSNVVVSAGPAGLGMAAIDVAANMFKSKVIAVTDSEDRSDLMRDRGAFGTVVYNPKLQKDILSMTDKKGAQIVYDAVSDFMLDGIGTCVSNYGHIFYAAPLSFKTIPAPPCHSSSTIVSLRALRLQDPNLYKCMVNDTLDLAHEGILSAHVSARFPIDEINKAIEYIDQKKCTGKVVVHITSKSTPKQ